MELVSITGTVARIRLNRLLNHTVKQIVDLQTDVNVQHVQTKLSSQLEVVLMC